MKKTRLEIYDEFPNSLIDEVIGEWIKNQRDRRILHYKLIDGLTFEKIAELEDMSPKRIQNIIYAAENKLFSNLKIKYHNK